MIIGLMDWDLTKWKSPTVFNLELMKLSYYYKMRQHIVQMVRRYRSDMVTRLYIQKDYEDFDYGDGSAPEGELDFEVNGKMEEGKLNKGRACFNE